MERYSVRVSDVRNVGGDVGIVRLVFGDGVPFPFRPGQYVIVQVEVAGERHLKPYSIASPPSEKRFIELCIKVVPDGVMSNYMVSLKKGGTIRLSGPAGFFVLQDEVKNDIVFAATGTGISALKPMIETVFEKGTRQKIFLFYGAKTPDELAYREVFEKLAKRHKNFLFVPVVSRDPSFAGEKGHVQDVIPKYAKNPKGMDVYICGVLSMVEETMAWAEQFGFEKKKMHFEKYV